MNVNKLRPTGADVEDDVKCYEIVHPPDRLPDRQSDRLPSVSSSDHLAEESKRVFLNLQPRDCREELNFKSLLL